MDTRDEDFRILRATSENCEFVERCCIWALMYAPVLSRRDHAGTERNDILYMLGIKEKLNP